MQSQLLEKLFADGPIVTCSQSQHFATEVWRQVTDKAAACFCFLSCNILLKFSITFLIGNFGGFPCFAKEQSTLFRIDLPQRVSDAGERPCAKCLVVEGTRVG